MDLAIRILERGADYSWYARVALVSGWKPYNDLHLPCLIITPLFFQPYVHQMSQRVNGPTPSAELSGSPILGVPSRTESDEPGSGDPNMNRDDLYLFTRGQVFRKSGQRSSAPPRSLSFPGPSSGVPKLPPQSFGSYSDPGFDTPALTLLSFPGQQDGYPSYSNHGNNHGYHSTSSSPAIQPSFVPPLDMFPLDNADQLPMFGSTTNGTTAVDGVDPSSSTSWAALWDGGWTTDRIRAVARR